MGVLIKEDFFFVNSYFTGTKVQTLTQEALLKLLEHGRADQLLEATQTSTARFFFLLYWYKC